MCGAFMCVVRPQAYHTVMNFRNSLPSIDLHSIISKAEGTFSLDNLKSQFNSLEKSVVETVTKLPSSLPDLPSGLPTGT